MIFWIDAQISPYMARWLSSEFGVEAREGRRVVVVLDNAPFHKAGAVRDARWGWEAKGLELYYLPAYCSHLNLIEGVWRRLSKAS